MESRNVAEFWKAMSIMGLFLGIVLGLSAAAFIHRPPKEIRLEDVRCTVNPSSFLVTEGWMELHDVDQARVTNLMSQGKAELKQEPSLICYDVRPWKPYRVIVEQEWWRRI